MVTLDHIGIAVKNVSSVLAMLEKVAQLRPGSVEEVASQGIRAHFIPAGAAKLELLEALSPNSKIASFLEKRGEGVHHIAFRVQDIRAAWRTCLQNGYVPIGESPQQGAGGKSIFFLHPRDTHGILIEFCQEKLVKLEPIQIPFSGGMLAGYTLGPPEAEPLLVLHGAAGSTHLETAPIIKKLAKEYRVYAIDFPAHGHSTAFEERAFSHDFFLESIVAAYTHFGLEKAHIFGFSLGGGLALYYATRYPEKVDKLVVHGANLNWSTEDKDTLLRRLDPAVIQSETPGLSYILEEMHPSGWVSLFKRMMVYVEEHLSVSDLTTPLLQLDHRVLVSATDKDDYFSITTPLHIYQTLPNASLAIIPGDKHALQNLPLTTYLPIVLNHLKHTRHTRAGS